MTSRARTLSAFAAAALLAPLLPFAASPAFAVPPEPPAPRDVADLCENVPADFEPFSDIDGNTFEDNIECLAFAEITQGQSGGRTYGPGGVVRRDQMASFIARLIDRADELDTGDNIRTLPAFDGTVDFTDVAANNTHRENIDRLAEAGVVAGGPGGRPTTQYGPQLEVTRAQMASFIRNALQFMTGEDIASANDYFTDDETATPHEPRINAVAERAIAVGDGRDLYNPFGSVTRGQMAGFLTRTLALLESTGEITPVGAEDPVAPDVTVEDSTVAAGEDIAFTVESDDIASVTVSGDCVETETFDEDADSAAAGFQVVVATQEDAEDGSCDITLEIVDEEGNTFTSAFTVTIGTDADDIAVTPNTEESREARANPDSSPADDRTYQASGLVSGVEYRVTLVRSENVRGDGATATFKASADPNSTTGFSADTGSPTADIVSINGTAGPDSDAGAVGFQRGTATFTATSTSFSFVVDGDAANESVRPVVYRNGSAGRSPAEGGTGPRLEVDASAAGEFAQPVEPFGLGGATRYTELTTQPVTVRPELVSTEIARTFTDQGPTPSAEDNRQLTEVRFTFDEEVTGANPDEELFHLVGFDSDNRFDGTDARVEQSRNSVLVTFGTAAGTDRNDPDGESVGAEELRDISLATVDFDAVRDVGGAENLIGDDVIGTSRTDTRGAAGITDAPDLQSVGSFFSPAGQGTTQVTFTFDEQAFTVDAEGFHLVTVNNRQIDCAAVDGPNGGTPGTGGEVDNTIVADCEEMVLGRDIAAADISRGFVEAETVSDEEQEDPTGQLVNGNTNPLQATQTPDADTSGPDLASATFERTTATDSDRVVFTFDEPVLLLNDTDTDGMADPRDRDTDGRQGELDFRVYPFTGGEGTEATEVMRSATNSTQVIALFPDGSLEDAVGANVLEAAVTSATGVAGRANQEDEVGVANLRQTDFVAGQTDGPDLRGVTVRAEGTAVFTFDETVQPDAPAATMNIVEGELLLHLADGARLMCAEARAGTDTADNTVTCTRFTVVVQGGADATTAQIQSAVLGTVDDGAVQDTNGNVSPEGAENTTGTTGTPRQ